MSNQLLEQSDHCRWVLDVDVVTRTFDVVDLRGVHPQLLQRHYRIVLATRQQDGAGCARCALSRAMSSASTPSIFFSLDSFRGVMASFEW